MAVKYLKPPPFLPSSQLNVFYESCKTELAVNGNGEEINQDVPEGHQHWFNPLNLDANLLATPLLFRGAIEVEEAMMETKILTVI